jgi:hypothetical protein
MFPAWNPLSAAQQIPSQTSITPETIITYYITPSLPVISYRYKRGFKPGNPECEGMVLSQIRNSD